MSLKLDGPLISNRVPQPRDWELACAATLPNCQTDLNKTDEEISKYHAMAIICDL